MDFLLSSDGRPSHTAAKQATASVPIVFASVDSVLHAELMAPPSSNPSGVLFWSAELADKRLELLQTTLPRLKRGSSCARPCSANALVRLEALQAAAPKRQLEVVPLEARDPDQLAPALDAAAQAQADALIVLATPLFTVNRVPMAELTAADRLPALYESRETVDVGGLMSYGQSSFDDFRRAGRYVGRLLDGARPSELLGSSPNCSTSW